MTRLLHYSLAITSLSQNPTTLICSSPLLYIFLITCLPMNSLLLTFHSEPSITGLMVLRQPSHFARHDLTQIPVMVTYSLYTRVRPGKQGIVIICSRLRDSLGGISFYHERVFNNLTRNTQLSPNGLLVTEDLRAREIRFCLHIRLHELSSANGNCFQQDLSDKVMQL